jgi:N-carbamoyl-L-amino-acid hydrolase
MRMTSTGRGSMVARLDGGRLLQDLEALGQIGAAPSGGINRIAYSPADQEARAWIGLQMQELGLKVTRDQAGNTIGIYSGRVPELSPIALGSHTDTVPDGGRYDGALGVVGALACVRALRDASLRLRHSVEVINFAAEEATMPGATLGSRAMAGLLAPAVVDELAWDGRTVAEHLRAAGLEPQTITHAQQADGSLAAYLELHVEQGSVLEDAGVPIGVVEGIVGIRRYLVTFQGFANHAGTTPMDSRRDALVMAAPFILAVRDVAVQRDITGTVGTLRLEPGAPNVIPGRVELGVEIRGLDQDRLDSAEEDIEGRAREAGAEVRRVSAKPPVRSDPRLVEALVGACGELGLAYRRMPSGAGHDAMCIASIAAQAMLFVPSRHGVSHSPEEYTAPESCVAGAKVMLAALLALDARLDAGL